jgi:hypothetical protein
MTPSTGTDELSKKKKEKIGRGREGINRQLFSKVEILSDFGKQEKK